MVNVFYWLARRITKNEKQVEKVAHNLVYGFILQSIPFWILSGIAYAIFLGSSAPFIENPVLMFFCAIIVATVVSILCTAFALDDTYKKAKREFVGVLLAVLFNVLILATLTLSFFPLIWLLIPIVILAEICFFFDKAEPAAKVSKFWFAASRKFWAVLESAIYVLVLTGIVSFTNAVIPWFEANKEAVLGFFGVVGIIAAVVFAFVVWVWLNSLKYNGGKK